MFQGPKRAEWRSQICCASLLNMQKEEHRRLAGGRALEDVRMRLAGVEDAQRQRRQVDQPVGRREGERARALFRRSERRPQHDRVVRLVTRRRWHGGDGIPRLGVRVRLAQADRVEAHPLHPRLRAHVHAAVRIGALRLTP